MGVFPFGEVCASFGLDFDTGNQKKSWTWDGSADAGRKGGYLYEFMDRNAMEWLQAGRMTWMPCHARRA